jgi:hypothetical protein
MPENPPVVTSERTSRLSDWRTGNLFDSLARFDDFLLEFAIA